MSLSEKKAWLLGLLVISAYTRAQTGGSIKGIVVDENGKPVARAEVHIAEKKPSVGHRMLHMYETSGGGEFLIPNVPWGTYVVMAGKEDAGYPDTKLAFYSNLVAPTVTLAPAFPAATANVKFGPKAGVLEIAPTTDAETGKKIDSATITLRRKQNPSFFITTSATGGRILVPSFTDVAVEIAAPEYKSWPGREAARTEGKISLKPGEVLSLQVKLQPDRSSQTER